MESNETVTVNVIALKSFSTGTISMFKGEIREMDADTAETLIDNGLVAEYVPDVPEVGANDKDKYLHTNAETGAKEWSNVPSELPTVTIGDAGKVLGVNESGVWVATNPSSGGGNVEIVKCIAGSPNTCDHTYAQLKAAYEAGKVLYCDSLYQGQHLCGILSYEENQYVGHFAMYVRNISSSQWVKTTIANDDSITIASA